MQGQESSTSSRGGGQHQRHIRFAGSISRREERKKRLAGGTSTSTSQIHNPPQSIEIEFPFRSDISGDEVRRESTIKTIESEFVSKYLEKIGVKPTKATSDLMRKLTPINLSTLDTQLKPGKNSETDVCVSLKASSSSNSVQNTDNQYPTSSDVISLGILNQLPEAFARQLEQKKLAKEKAFSSFENQNGDSNRSDGNLFEQASTQHLYPYNLKKKQESSLFAASKKKGGMHSQDVSSSNQSEEITEHLVQIFQKDFIQGLDDWRSQNSVSLKGSWYLKERAFSHVTQTLLSPPVLKLFKVTACYLINKDIHKEAKDEPFIGGNTSAESESRKETEQAERLYFILHEFSRLNKAKENKDKSGLCFVLPVLLLSLRSFVEHIVKLLFPGLLATPEGKLSLQQMDSTISTLLDPHGWYSKVSVFQSTRQSLQIMNSYRQSAHQPTRSKFHNTSPLVRAALGNPLSSNYPEYRQVLLGKILYENKSRK